MFFDFVKIVNSIRFFICTFLVSHVDENYIEQSEKSNFKLEIARMFPACVIYIYIFCFNVNIFLTE